MSCWWYGRCIEVNSPKEDVMLMILLLVLLVLAIVGGGWGHSRWGYAGWSPAGVILTALVVLWFAGYFHR